MHYHILPRVVLLHCNILSIDNQRRNTPSKVRGKVRLCNKKILGKGAWGTVYVGLNEATRELIAVKEIIFSTKEVSPTHILLNPTLASRTIFTVCWKPKHGSNPQGMLWPFEHDVDAPRAQIARRVFCEHRVTTTTLLVPTRAPTFIPTPTPPKIAWALCFNFLGGF